MNSRISLQKLKGLVLVQSILTLVLTATDTASAINIKNTDYPIPSDAYFVSPDGKDSNSGKSADSPWTLKKALSSVPSDSTIVLRGGTYRNVKATINKQLTLQAYPHEQPWLKGSVVVTNWVADGSIWRKDGWRYSFPSKEVKQAIDPEYPMGPYRDMVYINGVSLKQVASKAKVEPGTFYVNPKNDKLYIGSNPAGKTVEATALNIGLYFWQGGANSVVRGLGMAHYADMGVRVQGPSIKLENNTLVWNGWLGTYIGSSDTILRGNTISYNGATGVSAYKVNRMLMENNTISYNNVEHFAKTWGGAGAKIVFGEGTTWRNNKVENNFATGLWVDDSTTNSKIVNNTVHDNDAIGIQMELSHAAIIAGNVVYKNAYGGIVIADSSNARVFNNTLSLNQKNFVVKDSSRKNTDGDEVDDGITWVSRNNVVKNNILSNTLGGPLFDAASCSTYKNSNQMLAAADNNAYYRDSSNDPQILINWSLGADNCSKGYQSLTAFKSATNGYENDSISFNDVSNNPFFVNENNGDYRLKASSSAIGRGEALPADIASAIGLPSGIPVDLGALQFNTVIVN